MQTPEDWQIPSEFRPDPAELDYDLDAALASVVALSAKVPEDAFTAGTLGTERAGQGVVIRGDGLVLTIGYLITEASEVWLKTNAGRTVAGHALAYDYETGFGLVKALGVLDVPAMPIGDSRRLRRGDDVVVIGAGGRTRSLGGKVVARQEFAGYWEYLIADAIFTAPAHPHWGGTAVVGPRGDLVGIGSLQLHSSVSGGVLPLNMSVPIDLLKPVLDHLLRTGRSPAPPRPWLGLYVREDEDDRIVLVGLAGNGPAKRAGLKAGDAVLAVKGAPTASLADFYRSLWGLGEAGVDVPLTLDREGDVFDVVVRSSDRGRHMKGAGRLH